MNLHPPCRVLVGPVAPLVKRALGGPKERVDPLGTPAEQVCQGRKETEEFLATAGPLDRLALR